jgi:long-chain fatty acid transport protein
MRKRTWMFALVLVAGGILLGPRLSLGSGFALYEAGARSSALAGAVVARADDLSAIFYNPAGLTQLSGCQVMGGMTAFFPRTEIVTHAGSVATPNLMETNGFVSPHFFTSYQASNRVWLGLGVFSPFGLGTQFNSGWPGNVSNIKTNIQTLTINPTIALKASDYLSFGAGLDLMYFSLDMNRMLPIPFLGNQELNLTGHSWGLGFNLGIHFKPLDYLSAGISYRSQVRQRIMGVSYFHPYNSLDASATGTIILPDMVFAGIMVQPIKPLSVEVGFIWTHWGLFNKLDVNFNNALGILSEKKEWRDTWRPQIGIEYKPLAWLDLRAGYAFEHEPMPNKFADYLVPTTDRRHNFSLGTGVHWRAWTIDLAYTFVYLPDKSITNSQSSGVLASDFQGRRAQLLGVSLSYKLF